jgi:hypothetical protein
MMFSNKIGRALLLSSKASMQEFGICIVARMHTCRFFPQLPCELVFSPDFSAPLRSGARFWSVCRSSTLVTKHLQLVFQCQAIRPQHPPTHTSRINLVLYHNSKNVCKNSPLRGSRPRCWGSPHANHRHPYLQLDVRQACRCDRRAPCSQTSWCFPRRVRISP